jgi:hypothetical protein
MKNGFKAMDSDMHVMEPCDLWQKYIDRKYLDRAPIGLNRHKRDLGVEVDGKVMPRPTPKPNPELRPLREKILHERYQEEEARDFDNVAQLRTHVICRATARAFPNMVITSTNTKHRKRRPSGVCSSKRRGVRSPMSSMTSTPSNW